ncbi:ABC transporter permease [Aliihoeflea sp. PC F10.4]
MVRKTHFNVLDLPAFGVITFLVFVILYMPVCVLVVYSFSSSAIASVYQGFTFDWYRSALRNQAVIDATILSLQLASLAAIISTTVATLAALGTTRAKFAGQTAIYFLITQPLIIPSIVMAVAFLIITASIKSATGYNGIGYLVFAHSVFCIPLAYLPIRARLEAIDPVLQVAASDLYANRWQTFRRVTAPLLFPGIGAGFTLAFIASLDDVVITEFVKGAGQETLPTYMLSQLRVTMTPEVHAISTLILAFTVVALGIVAFLNGVNKNGKGN